MKSWRSLPLLTLFVPLALLVATATSPAAETLPATKVAAVVNADRSVTFSLTNEQAESVEIGGDFRFGRKAVGRAAIGSEPTGSVPSVPMKKSADGVWTTTSEPRLPMIYRYFFVVDGTRTPIATIEIDGPAAMPWDLRADIPHGTLVAEKLRSGVLKTVKEVLIYLPPSYWSGDKSYPVLYLLPGGGDIKHSDWVDEGHADNIMDSLIADGKAKEMIVVMPSRFTLSGEEKSAMNSLSKKDLEASLTARDDLRDGYYFGELMPLIESRYRASKEMRFVAGLSGGAGESFDLITQHPGTFTAAGMFSGSVGMSRSENYEPYRSMVKDKLEGMRPDLARLKLLYVSCGDYDPQRGPIRALRGIFDELGIRHVYMEGEGGHQWPFWSRSLVDFVSRLSAAL